MLCLDTLKKKIQVLTSRLQESIKVLIVDDERIWHTMIIDAIRNPMLRIESAYSYPEAVELLTRNKYHFLFVDILLGDPECTGVHLIKKVKHNWSVVLSGYDNLEAGAAAVGAGARFVLRKDDIMALKDRLIDSLVRCAALSYLLKGKEGSVFRPLWENQDELSETKLKGTSRFVPVWERAHTMGVKQWAHCLDLDRKTVQTYVKNESDLSPSEFLDCYYCLCALLLANFSSNLFNLLSSEEKPVYEKAVTEVFQNAQLSDHLKKLAD
jgi:ActR/RegA family two-component response regulator